VLVELAACELELGYFFLEGGSLRQLRIALQLFVLDFDAALNFLEHFCDVVFLFAVVGMVVNLLVEGKVAAEYLQFGLLQ